MALARSRTREDGSNDRAQELRKVRVLSFVGERRRHSPKPLAAQSRLYQRGTACDSADMGPAVLGPYNGSRAKGPYYGPRLLRLLRYL